jgi:hypothetical protein
VKHIFLSQQPMLLKESVSYFELNTQRLLELQNSNSRLVALKQIFLTQGLLS